MPGVTSEGKPKESYGYDIGGRVEKIADSDRSDKMPSSGQLGRLDELNINRFYERKGNDSAPPSVMAKTGYETTSFDKDGNVKAGPKSDVDFLQKDGSWAPAEGRDPVKSMKLGGGGRFQKLSASLEGKVSNPGAVAAAIGRKKYGAEKMAKMSAAGRRRS